MKSLNTYILEKLIINKNFKGDFMCVQPKNEGTCLELVVPYSLTQERIALYIREYKYDSSKNNVFIDEDIKYEQNDEGYYTNIDDDPLWWKWVLLFDEDAKLFLNILLEDYRQKMDISNICKSSLKERKSYKFPCMNDAKKYYSKYELKHMLESIK